MTRLEAIEKIRKLPKLKDGYEYEVSWFGAITICNEGTPAEFGRLLYQNFEEFTKDKYHKDIKEYEHYFAKPIVKDVVIKQIVGYE